MAVIFLMSVDITFFIQVLFWQPGWDFMDVADISKKHNLTKNFLIL